MTNDRLFYLLVIRIWFVLDVVLGIFLIGLSCGCLPFGQNLGMIMQFDTAIMQFCNDYAT